jgi:hypothetical protein
MMVVSIDIPMSPLMQYAQKHQCSRQFVNINVYYYLLICCLSNYSIVTFMCMCVSTWFTIGPFTLLQWLIPW